MKARPYRTQRPRSYVVALAALVVAVAAIVLLRSRGAASGGGSFRPLQGGSASFVTFEGPSLEGHAGFAQGLLPAGGTRAVGAEIRLTPRGGGLARRQPVALGIVLDVSGSMSGEKIEGARRAVEQLVERMHDDDRVAVVVYNHEARLLEPLSRVGGARARLARSVAALEAGGGTDIPSGLTEGFQALLDAPRDMVRRVVLVSDGLDGSGRDLDALQREVATRAEKGLTLSSLGIGLDYDERFLATVADAGHGSYAFLATGGELQRFLTRELDQATATVLDDVVVELRLPEGFRLVDTTGVGHEGREGRVRLPVGALAAGTSRSLVLELEVDARAAGELGAMEVSVRYRTVDDGEPHRVDGGAIALAASHDDAQVVASYDAKVRAETEAARIDRQQAAAVEAWRAGDGARASALARDNAAALRGLAAAMPEPSPALTEQLRAAEDEARAFEAVPAASAEGRAIGLRSNADRRERALH